MKVCMITYSLYEMDPRIRREAESLASRGDTVDVICLRGENSEKHDRLGGVEVYRIMQRRDESHAIDYFLNLLRFFLSSSFKITELFLKRRHDVIHVISYPDFEVFATIIPKIFGTKTVLNIHELNPEFFARKFGLHESHIIVGILKWVEKVSCRYAHHVITITDRYKEILVERSVLEPKCTVLLSVPDPKTFTPTKRKPKDDTITIMSFGKLSEYYGIDLLIRAMDTVKRHVPTARLEINAYDGPEREAIMKLVEDLRLEKYVRFSITKLRPLDDYSEMMQEADIGVDPRRGGLFVEDTLSSVILNFFTTGIPTVTSRTKAAETYFDESMVMFFDPDDDHDLARCIIDLCKHPRKREELVRNADQFIQQHSWKHYEKIYHELNNGLVEREISRW